MPWVSLPSANARRANRLETCDSLARRAPSPSHRSDSIATIQRGVAAKNRRRHCSPARSLDRLRSRSSPQSCQSPLLGQPTPPVALADGLLSALWIENAPAPALGSEGKSVTNGRAAPRDPVGHISSVTRWGQPQYAFSVRKTATMVISRILMSSARDQFSM